VSSVLSFEPFEIRVAERTVLVRGAPVALGARAFDVLLALAERCDRVVSKAELLDLAWPGVVVEENNLTVQISALRKALGPSAIATVVGRGYRLTSPRHADVRPERPEAEPPPAARLQRRLVAVVQADVVGWARLVARDPMAAARAWKRIRTERIERSAPAYGGRPIELTAERVQLEFASACEAVAWSLELQQTLQQRRQTPDADEGLPVHMRIGIAVDDAIVDDGKLVGDGVNVAAELQQSAGHDEVLVTHRVREFVAHRSDARFVDLGERLSRRLQRPLQVFRVDAAAAAGAAAPPLLRANMLARVATLAVLPFTVDGAAEGYFGDGITEEIIATLSLNRALFVIAHSSTMRYRGQAFEPAAVADELGVRYLVTGSVQRAGPQVRIRAALVFAADQRLLWQQHFDGTVDDVFAFQAEIAASVAAAIAPRVQDEEVARARLRPTERHDAYDCVLRALAGIYRLGTAEFDTAGRLLQRAIELDPDYAQAHAHMAWWYSLLAAEGRAAPGVDAGRLALEHALQAIRIDGRDAWALSVAGYMMSLQTKQHAQALELYEQALTLNPSCAAAWARSAATLCYVGRADEALQRIQRAMKLSPFDEHQFWQLTICGSACFVARRFDECAGWLAKALRLSPRYNGARRIRIAALAHMGELDEARALSQGLLDDVPDFSVQEFGRWSPLAEPHRSELLRGLRLAGLPD
jgi:TolB-like protein/DNA-binding winged helix-turn-helix (wHTH) protein